MIGNAKTALVSHAALLQRLAAGENILDQIDWEYVIAEVQSAGRRQLETLKFLLVQALASLLKVQAWPVSFEVARWRTEASEYQREAAAIITPKMRQKIDINSLYFKAIRCLPKTIKRGTTAVVSNGMPRHVRGPIRGLDLHTATAAATGAAPILIDRVRH